MIIAIWGASATAKTSLAKCLAEKLGLPLRHCGDAVRLAAADAGVPIDSASDALHRSVDDATREWARCRLGSGAILEGRFLDRVLIELPEVALIQSTCGSDIRCNRWGERTQSSFDEAQLAALDNADDLFRLRMYGADDRGAPQITLDTSFGEVDQWAKQLLSLMESSRNLGHD
jgi:cytidylate kinase